MHHRVFAALDSVPTRAAIEALLAARGVRCSFAGDDEGWYRAELSCDGTVLVLERYGADEEGIRAELNAWAGHLETLEHGPAHEALMERTIQARQLFTLGGPAGPLCEALCRYLAHETDGFYHIDECGFFAADGSLLIADPA
jgi:hypothetical protein